jgi:hypothetical protein
VPVAINSRDELTGSQRKILDAYAFWHSLGVPKPPRENIAAIAGYGHVRSRGFTDPLYAVRSAGLVEDDALTAHGQELAEWPASLGTLEAYHDKLRRVLKGPPEKLFNAIHELGGATTRDALATATGYGHVRSRGFTDPLYRLSSFGVVELGRDGEVQGTELMYPSALVAGQK